MTLTLARKLAEAAQDAPDSVFVRTQDGDVTYRVCAERAAALANTLAAQGVARGDAVALMMANGADQVALWFALSALQAIHAPLNTELAAGRLAHALRVSGARIVVADREHAATVSEASAQAGLRVDVVLVDALARAASEHPIAAPSTRLDDPVDDLSTATLLFTSGTTGVSKACALSHRYLVRQGEIHAKYLEISSTDVLYCPFPLFHIDAATLTVSAALAARATAALGRRFSASGFWGEVRRFDATVFNFMGATLSILWKQPAGPGDREHRVRVAWGVPIPDWHAGFEERFGFPLRQVYGLTDAGVPVYDPLTGARKVGAAGRVIDEFEVRIDRSQPCLGAPRTVGEILVRGREPGLVMNGYFGMPDETAATIAGGWVRTQDLGELDADGFLTFRGRLSDSIRRRGENISAFEVEELVASHPGVLEVAAVGVPSELTEEDVMVFVVLRDGRDLAARALHRHCLEHGPSHMAPRFIEFVGELPKTPTEKIEKFKLKRIGVRATTWDGEHEPHLHRPGHDTADDHSGHSHGPGGHGHSHGLVDRSIVRSREGVNAVAISLAVLGATALAQAAIFALSGSVALLADLIHNFGDALTAIPLGIAFYLRSFRGEQLAGLAVVAAIFVSACVALYETIQRLIHPHSLTHLWILAAAGVIGFAGNEIAAHVRLRAGHRLSSPALLADGAHARIDGLVSLGVVASAIVVALGLRIADPLIGLAITIVILRITWDSWRTVSKTDQGKLDSGP